MEHQESEKQSNETVKTEPKIEPSENFVQNSEKYTLNSEQIVELEEANKTENFTSFEDKKDDTPSGSKKNKTLKTSEKLKKVSNEIEKKMLEFYNIKCEKCEGFKFTSFKMLSKHYTTVHNTQGYIKCCKRNIRVNDKYYLRSHMFKHLQPDICRLVFNIIFKICVAFLITILKIFSSL